MTFSLDPAWVGIGITLFGVGGALLAWYIRVTVDRATATINTPNHGSHIVDRVEKLEKNNDLLLANQLLIMKHNGIEPVEE